MPATKSPGRKPLFAGEFEYPAERLVPQHEPVFARRRPAIVAGHDFPVGPAYTDCQAFNED